MSSGKKKKKKKKIATSKTVMEPSELPQIAQNRLLGAGLRIHEIVDDESVSKRSSRSKSKGKKSKTSVRPGSKSRERLDQSKNLDDSHSNLNNFGGFNYDDKQSNRSKSKKKKKKPSASRANQETMGDEFEQ